MEAVAKAGTGTWRSAAGPEMTADGGAVYGNVTAMSGVGTSTRLLAQNDQNNQQNDPAGHRDIQPGHACNPRYRLKSGCKIQVVLAAAICAAAGFRPTLPQLTSHRSSQSSIRGRGGAARNHARIETATCRRVLEPSANQSLPRIRTSFQSSKKRTLRSHRIVAPVDRHFDLVGARELLQIEA